jgi:DNA topoisomerase-1
MQEKVLVIVESPTKARTIKKFLPANYVVEASVGHIRDLPQTAAEVPKSVKDQEWSRLGIDVEHDFAPLYVTPKGKSKLVTHLKKLVKESSVLYLATDEDREGESISWHLVEVLSPGKVPVKRMVFHEITKQAITEALAHPRDIDMNLVKAQETRRVLDRLYGFTLSPLLWKKISYGLSAGRVQSPGLRLIVEREFERVQFKKSVYWDLVASLKADADKAAKGDAFEARLVGVGGKRVATGKDFDPDTGSLKASKDLVVLTEAEARDLEKRLRAAGWKVADISEKEVVSRPAAPFITSSLQQEGNRKLGLSSRDTMRIAQKLYEEGFITYMRTDSPTLSQEGINAARSAVEQAWGKDYLSPQPRQFSAKSSSAQEAHEAIRPAGTTWTHPDQTGLSGAEKRLYEMIWKRTIATQMADARKASMSVRIEAGDAAFQANGSRIIFPGFLRAYVEGSDDPEAALEDKEVILPPLSIGQVVNLVELGGVYHETKPPARYTEASLIQRLEKEGIGRPSTYASIIGVLFERNYVRKVGNALAPTYTGIGVIQFLEKNFNDLVEYSFTSDMENSLDDIAVGKTDRLAYLKKFYLGKDGLKEQVDSREKQIKPEESRTVRLPQLVGHSDIKIGRFGPYIVYSDPESGEAVHASIPEEWVPGELTVEQLDSLITIQKEGPSSIGTDPGTGLKVFCLVGRYGPYLQLGETTPDNPKPRRAPLPKDAQPDQMSLDQALRLLSLPRNVGKHPETGKDLIVNTGRFGPYVMHDGDFRSLKKDDDVYTVTRERCLELLAEEKKSRASSKVLKDLGTAPNGDKLAVMDGKYGPYIKAGSANVGLPDELKTPEGIAGLDLERALALAAEAAAKPKATKGRKRS